MDHDDWKWIEAYARDHSEAAFRALAGRYAGLVHASALRQTGDAQMAQDVAQAVFTLLAHKAGSLPRATVLSGWLFQTTRFVAARAVRAEQRRRRREQEAFDMQQSCDSADETWRRMAPIIDEAVARLSPGDREAVLLRHFEGRSVREVSQALEISEDAAKKRLLRALEKLRRILGRSGLVLSTAVIGAALTDRVAGAVSESFVSVLSSGALEGGGPTSGVTVLVKESLAAWRRVKAMWATGAGLALVATLVFVVPILRNAFVTAPTVSRGTASPDIANAGRSSPASTGRSTVPANPAGRVMKFRAVTAETGAAIADAPVLLQIWRTGAIEPLENRVTDRTGACELRIAGDATRIDVGVMAPGWAARYATWPSDGQREFPSEYTLRLVAVTNVIGGVIRDPAGNPLPDVSIYFFGHEGGDSAHRARPTERFGFADLIRIARTDHDGRWSMSSIPPRHPGFQLEARHRDYADTTFISSGPRQNPDEKQEGKLEELWSGRLNVTMDSAFTLMGVVVDERDAPVPGAKIQHREQSEIFVADDQGRFAVPKLVQGSWEFTVTAEGFAPVRTNALLGPGAPGQPVSVKMQSGAILRLRVIDENEIEVPGAEVGLEQWGNHRGDFTWRARTDFKGRVEWKSAPPDVELNLFARSEGFCYTRDFRTKADGSEHTMQIHRTLELYGRVVDATTGLPVPSMKAVPGYGAEDRFHDSDLRWYGLETVRGSNGMFQLTFNEKQYPWQVRVQADGYEDWTSPPLTNRIQDVIDIALRPLRPEDSVRGIVLNPDGSPAIGAQVALLGFEHNVILRGRSFEGNKRWMVRAGAGGSFSFQPNRLAHSIAVANEAGYIRQRVDNPREALALRLEAWGRVEGEVDAAAARAGVSTLELYDPAADNYQGRVSLLGACSVKPGADFRFTFDCVPPGEFCVFVNSGAGIPFHHQTSVTVLPGETIRVVLTERRGTRIRGRVLWPPNLPAEWKKEHRVAQFYAALPQAGQFVSPGPASELRRREFEFWTSPKGREHVNTPRVYSGVINDDGILASLEPLPPGKYRFTAVVKNSSATVPLEVPEDAPAEIDLGEIQLR